MAAGAGAAWVSMVLIAVHSQHRCGTAPYRRLYSGTVPCGTRCWQGLSRLVSSEGGAVATTVADDAASARAPPMSTRFDTDFSTAWRPRSPSAATAPAPSPISSVTPARPSARSTTSSPARSSAFSSCCMPTSENLAEEIRDAVDPDADWQTQIRQAVEAYVGHIEARPAHHIELDPRAAVAGRRARGRSNVAACNC